MCRSPVRARAGGPAAGLAPAPPRHTRTNNPSPRRTLARKSLPVGTVYGLYLRRSTRLSYAPVVLRHGSSPRRRGSSMPAPATAAELLDLIQKSGVADEARLRAYV